MNKKILSLSLATLIGLSVMSGVSNANEITQTTTSQTINNEEYKSTRKGKQQLTDEQIQEVYNTLTEEEKALYDKYIKKPSREEISNLTQEERQQLKEAKKAEIESLTQEQKDKLQAIKEKLFGQKANKPQRLTDEQIQEAYNSLTEEEKAIYDKYIKKPSKEEMANLTQEERQQLKEAKKAEKESLTQEQKDQIKAVRDKIFGQKTTNTTNSTTV